MEAATCASAFGGISIEFLMAVSKYLDLQLKYAYGVHDRDGKLNLEMLAGLVFSRLLAMSLRTRRT